MKRFTETAKWRDPWFLKLTGHAKMLWEYLTDNCDSIGLIHIDFGLVARDCRLPIKEQHLTELGNRVETLGSGRYFLPKFIQFQYGELSADCPPHRSILKLVGQHNLTRSGLTYHYPNATLVTTLQDKTIQDQDKTGSGTEGSTEGNPPSVESEILQLLNAKSGRNFRATPVNLSFIELRLRETGVTVDGVRKMVERQCANWLGSKMAEYLRPETLFNKTKFDGYYAAKDLPVPSLTNGHTTPWEQIKATESVIEGVSRELRAIPSISPSVFPDEAAAAEARRKPLRERKARLIEQLGRLKAQQAGEHE